jgi:uncharacterized protein (TIGR00251 family)
VSISGRRVEISLRVHPNAARNGVVGFADGVWRLKIAAPPVKGRANRELITFLAQKLGLSKGSLTIIKGHTSRNKVIAIDGLTQEEITGRLLPA